MKGTDIIRISQKGDKHDILLEFLDVLLSAIIIGPAVVAYWRGTWILMDLYVYPDHLVYSAGVSLVLGLLGHLLFTFLQRPLAHLYHPDQHRLTYYFVSRLYTALFGFVCVNAYRGGWMLLDIYTGKKLGSVVTTTLVSIVALTVMRALRNLTAPPFAVVTDELEGYFYVPTMFQQTPSRNSFLYILDVLFSVFVVGNLVVFVWRGAWALVDIFLYPNNAAYSAWASLVVGYVIVIIAFSSQSLMKKACAKLQGCNRIALADIYLLFSFIGTINVWRGVWNLLNEYFLPENPGMSNWLTHGLCLIILILLKCSNSILVRGVWIDAAEEGGECVVFPCSYLRLFVKAKREEKKSTNFESKSHDKEMKSLQCLQEQHQSNNTSNSPSPVHLHLLPTTPTAMTPDELQDASKSGVD